ncbi:hypothetical protein MMC09_003277 [Bachmanniomyces sp. S44760]|nr:hypothetical protein [Bachmanniomyces sp. S44760]
MFYLPRSSIWAAIICCIHLVIAVPSPAADVPLQPSVLYEWSADPKCTDANTCVTDCKQAFAAICQSKDLSVPTNITVNDCTAFYWIDSGNVVPTSLECTAQYTQIVSAAKPGADGCGGTIGGALGYTTSANRTNTPIYALYPTDGNANCFKAPGDSSPVLAPNVLPNGAVLDTCPADSSRRRALSRLESRDFTTAECFIEDAAWGAACTGVCMATVTSTAWL